VKANITSDYIPGTAGRKVLVHLSDITPEEHIIISKNNMCDFVIAQHKNEPDHTFGFFYNGTTNVRIIERPSKYQADQLVSLLEHGFKEFNRYLAENKKPHLTSPGAETPWNFFDKGDQRFEHTWIVATTGKGKTTFLSALINEDLEKVKRGEASVIIIDSENEHLSHHLPRLARFGPGGDLYGRLIYLAPDLLHPLALNIFDFTGYQRLNANEQLQMLNTVRDMLMFFVGATVDVPTGHMRNIIDYCMRALVLIPNPTVYTFQQMLGQGGFQKLITEYPQLQSLDDDTREFLTTRMVGTYGLSLGSVRQRLDGITRNAFIKATFAQPQNRLNLFGLLKEPYVIVVNTDSRRLGKDTCALFGRFFLASLLRVVNRRIGGGLPVYVYADEAQKYIAQEDAVIDLIHEARRQKISLTLAHHEHSDIESATVLQALRGAAIHCRPSPPFKWIITVRNGLPIEIKPPNVDFKYMPKMSDAQWQDIMDGMHACFSPPLNEPKKKNNSAPPTDDDATTDR
jgi:hypothetical protein